MDAAAADPFLIDLDQFQGPLDLLLHLIRKQDIDIFDIPIARITEQFLAVVRFAPELELERAGEFLEMAATLVRIKAQMLFPRGSEEDEEDPRADLVRRLMEFEHFTEAARRLERAERERARWLGRGFVTPRPAPPAADAPLQTRWEDVWEAILRLGERTEAPAPIPGLSLPRLRVEDKVELVLSALGRAGRIEFRALVSPWGTRMHAVVSLLACLELAKRHAIHIQQAEPFGPLWILECRRREAA